MPANRPSRRTQTRKCRKGHTHSSFRCPQCHLEYRRRAYANLKADQGRWDAMAANSAERYAKVKEDPRLLQLMYARTKIAQLRKGIERDLERVAAKERSLLETIQERDGLVAEIKARKGRSTPS